VRIGSLFSGIGGLELGLERAGLGHVVWQVENNAFCRAVLARHWPEVERFEDVSTPRVYPPADLICGGFPCQDVSSAGRGAGLREGTRSGLWFEFRRIVSDLRPRWVLVENVTSGKRRWLPTVRRDLHVLGYDSVAIALSAADVGAPHLRRRVFVVAHPYGEQLRDQPGGIGGPDREGPTLPVHDGDEEPLADSNSGRYGGEPVGYPLLDGRPRTEGSSNERGEEPPQGGWWSAEPNVGRVVDGSPGRLDGRRRRARLRALGNAVVPQCAEAIGRMILSLEE
jgi:DNA (cytosine-5)-methyltransferase 1